MEQSFKSSAINYGLYLGGALALWTVLAYAVNLELLVNFWVNLLVLPLIIIVFGVVSTAKSKGILNGFISFKNAFTSYFITVLIGMLISSVVSIVLFNFIDPDAAIQLKEIAIEKSITMMEGFGAPADQVAQQLEILENTDFFSIGTQSAQFFKGLIFFIIIGLIVAAIMKKKNPDAQ
jgi:hypothetical protein